MADIQLPKTDTTIKTYTSVAPATQTTTAAPATTTPSTQNAGQVATDQSKVGTKDLSKFNDGFKLDSLPSNGMDSIDTGNMDNLDNIIPTTPVETKPDPIVTEPVISKPDPHYEEKIIEVAGSGMGSDKKFKMLPGELMAITEILKGTSGGMGGNGNLLTLEQMQKTLKEKYGIETQIKDNAIVSADGGRTLICDTNGNGMLDAGDIQFESALGQLNTYFADEAKRQQMKNMILEMIEKANEYSNERQDAANKEATKSAGTAKTTATAPVAAAGATAAPATVAAAPVVVSTPASTVTTAKPAETKTETKTEEKKTETTTKAEEKKEEKKPETYTVVKGDTLIGIAKKLGVDYADLKEANPQFYFDGKDSAGRKRESDGHWIYPGDKVNIPAKK